METQELIASLALAQEAAVTYTDIDQAQDMLQINWDTRAVTIPKSVTNAGVKNDHLSKKLVFSMDRYVCGVDLANHTFAIHFINVDKWDSKKKNYDDCASGVYPVTNIDLSVDGKVTCEWEITNAATQVVGDVVFALHVFTIVDSAFTYHLGTTPTLLDLLDTVNATEHGKNITPDEIEVYIQKMADLSAEIDAKVAAAEAAATRAEEAAANFEVDDTLSVAGKAADAAATGAKLSQLSSENAELKGDLGDLNNEYMLFDIVENSFVTYPAGKKTYDTSMSRTEFISCDGLREIIVFAPSMQWNTHNNFYADSVDDSIHCISKFTLVEGKNVITVPNNAKYFILSGDKTVFSQVKIVGNLRLEIEQIKEEITNVASTNKILIPSIVRCCPVVENNFYYQNMAKGFDPTTKMAETDTIYQGVEVRNTRFKVNITDSLISNGRRNVVGKVGFKFDKQNALEKDITFQMVPSNAGSGLNKKCLIIGDSHTDMDYYPYYLKKMFDDDAMNVEFLGTLRNPDFGNVANEGRSSWRMYDYTETSERQTGAGFHGVNPFWNTETNKLDFANYVATEVGGSVHYVLLCLGTNDLTQGDHYTKEEVKSYWDKMINSIHSYWNGVKIGVWLPPTRALCDNSTRFDIERANTINEWLLEWYDNREDENIFIMPSGLNVDPYHDYTMAEINASARNSEYKVLETSDKVHPSPSGFQKLADVAYTYIKYFGMLDS